MTREERFKKFIALGAKYLFVNDKEIYKEEALKPLLNHKIGSYKNIDVYSLDYLRKGKE